MSTLFDWPVDLLTLLVEAIGALAGVTIAIAGSIIAYKQTYGSAPLQLVTSHGVMLDMDASPSGATYTATLSLEVWNLRTYPIQVRYVHATFPGLSFLHRPPDHERRDWQANGNSLMLSAHDEVQIAPQARHLFKIEGDFAKRSLDNIVSNVKITTTVFDPMAAKVKKLHSKHEYRFGSGPALGDAVSLR
jgi:hypothetical protein